MYSLYTWNGQNSFFLLRRTVIRIDAYNSNLEATMFFEIYKLNTEWEQNPWQ